MHKSHVGSPSMTMRRYWKGARSTSRDAIVWARSAGDRGYRLVIATRLKAFITVASQVTAEIWSVVIAAAAAL